MKPGEEEQKKGKSRGYLIDRNTGTFYLNSFFFSWSKRLSRNSQEMFLESTLATRSVFLGGWRGVMKMRKETLLDFLLTRKPNPRWMDILRSAVVRCLTDTRGLVAYWSDLPTCYELRAKDLVSFFFQSHTCNPRANVEYDRINLE